MRRRLLKLRSLRRYLQPDGGGERSGLPQLWGQAARR
jgi:hypothetical protein